MLAEVVISGRALKLIMVYEKEAFYCNLTFCFNGLKRPELTFDENLFKIIEGEIDRDNPSFDILVSLHMGYINTILLC